MRFVYLDEAGVSNPKHEPYLVVAGVIVHADKQWLHLEKYLRDMVEDVIPPEKRKDFFFHAKDLFHGSGKTPREVFPKDYRWAVLDELCSLPKKFDLPVVMGFVDRQEMAGKLEVKQISDANCVSQAVAATQCAMATERYMRLRTKADEVAALVYEDAPQSKRLIRNTHNFLRSSDISNVIQEQDSVFVPLTRIVDTTHFAEKLDTSILQVADACAFAIKRKLMGKSDADRFYDAIEGQLVVKPRVFSAGTEA